MNRERSLERLRKETFDVLVVGGGITGCGIALDAASRGLRVALVEKGDFASGTSGKSSKLIHGGLRYLKQMQFKVTIEASREKALLKRLAPHLIEDLPFLLPHWTRRSRPLLSSGLWIYDAAAGFPKGLVHRHVGAVEALRELPTLRPDGLRGAFVYYDARADDCRLVLHVAKRASDLGAVMANYVEVTGLLKTGGRVAGARTPEFEISARRVVNATGVWCDGVRALDDAAAAASIRPSKGIHLVVPSGRLGLRSAAMLPSPVDGRIFFLIPWGDLALVGTTDTDYDGPPDRPRAEGEDVEYLLRRVNDVLPRVGLTRRDVLSTYAGLRPLLLGNEAAPFRASREHEIFESESGLLSITGGKLTTYRRMSRQVVDRVSKTRSRTHQIDLYATEARDPLSRLYGSEALRIIDHTPLVDGLPYVWGEVDFALEREMARTVTDVLARRTRIALYAPDQGRGIAPAVARRMAPRLGWDPRETSRQVDAYERELEASFPR